MNLSRPSHRSCHSLTDDVASHERENEGNLLRGAEKVIVTATGK